MHAMFLIILLAIVYSSSCSVMRMDVVQATHALIPDYFRVHPDTTGTRIHIKLAAELAAVDPPTKFVFVGDNAEPHHSCWGSAHTLLPKRGTDPLRYNGRITTPSRTGVFILNYSAVWDYERPPLTVQILLDVSCSDGIVCNGMEQYVLMRQARPNGRAEKWACQPAPQPLCDDGVACTVDTCLEDSSGGVCRHVVPLDDPNCLACQDPACEPTSCEGLVCGDDGCGGSCGSCPSTQGCQKNGTCGPLAPPSPPEAACSPACDAQVSFCEPFSLTCQTLYKTGGNCSSPLTVVSDFLMSLIATGNWIDTLTVYDDNTRGINQVTPLCNVVSEAPEILYRIDVPPVAQLPPDAIEGIGIQASIGSSDWTIDGRESLDTVLFILEMKAGADVMADCLKPGPTEWVACSDDSNPPGGVGSMVRYMLKPGHTYLLGADSYAEGAIGPYQLNVTFNPGCVPNCDGAFCGDSGCPAFSCGECSVGDLCSVQQRCVQDPCIGNCDGRGCDDDGCGGSCGFCGQGSFCSTDRSAGTSTCVTHLECNSMQPICNSCKVGQFCSTECTCMDQTAVMFDLSLDEASALPYVEDFLTDFSAASCALDHGCVSGGGQGRRLLRFSTNAINTGSVMFSPPGPPGEYPWLYKWDNCHGHWHLQNAILFRLISKATGQEVATGNKSSYCMEDSAIIEGVAAPWVPCTSTTSCNEQGLSPGWADVYGPTLDCQWLDITDLEEFGDFELEQCINPMRVYHEMTFENNCIRLPITVEPL